jgi:hypothetical protein
MLFPKCGLVLVDFLWRGEANSHQWIVMKSLNEKTNAKSQIYREVSIGESKNKLQNISCPSGLHPY